MVNAAVARGDLERKKFYGSLFEAAQQDSDVLRDEYLAEADECYSQPAVASETTQSQEQSIYHQASSIKGPSTPQSPSPPSPSSSQPSSVITSHSVTNRFHHRVSTQSASARTIPVSSTQLLRYHLNATLNTIRIGRLKRQSIAEDGVGGAWQ